MSTKEIVNIYKTIKIRREQTNKKLRDEIKGNTEAFLNITFQKYFKLINTPSISQSVKDTLQRDMTKTLSIIVMDSDHEVIMALTNNLLREKFNKTIQQELA